MCAYVYREDERNFIENKAENNKSYKNLSLITLNGGNSQLFLTFLTCLQRLPQVIFIDSYDHPSAT